jgi:hypothetical protein
MYCPAGKLRTYNRDDPKNPTEVTSIEVQYGYQFAKLDKVPGKDQWKSGEQIINGKLELDISKSVFTDFDHQIQATRTPDGLELIRYLKTGDEVERWGGLTSRVKKGDQTVAFLRDDKNSVNDIKDEKRNLHLEYQPDGSWKTTALHQDKPFTASTPPLVGEVEVNEYADCAFIQEDRTRRRLNFDGTEETLDTMANLHKRIEASPELTAEQKKKLTEEYLPKIAQRKFYGKNEKQTMQEINETSYQLTSLIDRPGQEAYSPQGRAKMLEQTAFHAGWPTLLRQHGKTCNVSDVAGSLLHESPSAAAKVIADLGTTGKLTIKDGFPIVPLRDDIEAALSMKNQSLGYTEVSKILAIALVNINMQRRTQDLEQNPIDVGTMVYRQWSGENGGQGEGIFIYNKGEEQQAKVGDKLADRPLLDPLEIMDVYTQITGKPETGRYIFYGNYEGLNNYYKQNRLWAKLKDTIVPVNSLEKFHKELIHGPFPKIIAVHNNHPVISSEITNQERDDHVVMLTNFRPVYKDAQKTIVDPVRSQVYFDNTNDPKDDHVAANKGVPLEQMYAAMMPRKTQK